MCDPHRCLILQAADVTREMAFVIVIPISSAKEKEERASWVEIPSGSVSGIPDRSFLICEQVRCVDKRRLERYVGKLGPVYIILAQKLLDFLCPSMLDQIPDNEILGSQTDTQKK
jgi:mRNA-degrading endonuclease toxin of MazEF toxin-antitoxin module